MPEPKQCGASPRCRQSVEFMVTLGSWPSVVCEKHMGTLVARKLDGRADSVTVKRL